MNVLLRIRKDRPKGCELGLSDLEGGTSVEYMSRSRLHKDLQLRILADQGLRRRLCLVQARARGVLSWRCGIKTRIHNVDITLRKWNYDSLLFELLFD